MAFTVFVERFRFNGLITARGELRQGENLISNNVRSIPIASSSHDRCGQFRFHAAFVHSSASESNDSRGKSIAVSTHSMMSWPPRIGRSAYVPARSTVATTSALQQENPHGRSNHVCAHHGVVRDVAPGRTRLGPDPADITIARRFRRPCCSTDIARSRDYRFAHRAAGPATLPGITPLQSGSVEFTASLESHLRTAASLPADGLINNTVSAGEHPLDALRSARGNHQHLELGPSRGN